MGDYETKVALNAGAAIYACGLAEDLEQGVQLALQAIASEVVQAAWLSRRGGDVWDLVADLAGAVVGVWLGVVLNVVWVAAGWPLSAVVMRSPV